MINKEYILLDSHFGIYVFALKVEQKIIENNLPRKENKLYFKTHEYDSKFAIGYSKNKILTISEDDKSLRCQIISTKDKVEENKKLLIEHMKKALETK